MKRYLLRPGGGVGGEVRVPGDKSISHRALMLGGIAEGTTEVTGFLASEDCLATLGALKALGVPIERPEPDRMIVHGTGARGLSGASGPLDMGNAGTAMRLLMGLLAGQPFDSTLIGDESLMRRPMERAAVPLRLMGARIVTQDGRPPVHILGGGALHGIDYRLPVASAQVKSAILLAALGATGATSVTEPAPTRDHTERMLSAFGVQVRRQGATVMLRGGQRLRAARIDVPGDFSSAAFFLVAGCLGARGALVLKGVGINPTRTGLLDLLRAMGADIRVFPRGVRGAEGASAIGGRSSGETAAQAAGGSLSRGEAVVNGGSVDPREPVADIEVRASALRGIEVPPALVPLAIDEFPVFFIAAAAAEGETIVRGAEELRVKETDRLAAMAEGLGRLGVEHELLADGLRIRGRGRFGGGTIDSHGDHRIAMAFAVASLNADAPIEILDVANVATSFPGFVDVARGAGLEIEAG